jgi:hypothetical protein
MAGFAHYERETRQRRRTEAKAKPKDYVALAQAIHTIARHVPDAEIHFSKSSLEKLKQKKAQKQAVALSPVLNVLAQTHRPVGFTAGAVDAAITNKNIWKAAKHGFSDTHAPGFSQVLKHLGAPKSVQGIGGFGLDVVADPTTWLTGGAGGIARRGAQGAALRGATVKVAGKEVPLIRQATAHTVGRAVQKAGTTNLGRGARNLLSDVNPNVAPAGVPRDLWSLGTMMARTTRAQQLAGVKEATSRAYALRKALGDNDRLVNDAIETRTVHKLPQHLQAPAGFLKQQYRKMLEAEREFGIPTGERSPYIPHYVRRSLEKGDAQEGGAIQGAGAVSKRAPTHGSMKARKREGLLSEKAEAFPGEYNEDAALAFYNRSAASSRTIAQAKLNRRLADEIGQPVRPNAHGNVAFDKDTESVFRLQGKDLHEIKDAAGLQHALEHKATANDRYVVMPKAIVKRAHAITAPMEADPVLRGYDKLTRASSTSRRSPTLGSMFATSSATRCWRTTPNRDGSCRPTMCVPPVA